SDRGRAMGRILVAAVGRILRPLHEDRRRYGMVQARRRGADRVHAHRATRASAASEKSIAVTRERRRRAITRWPTDARRKCTTDVAVMSVCSTTVFGEQF